MGVGGYMEVIIKEICTAPIIHIEWKRWVLYNSNSNTYTHSLAQIYMHTRARMHTHVHACTHIHTHTHTTTTTTPLTWTIGTKTAVEKTDRLEKVVEKVGFKCIERNGFSKG